MVEQLIEGGLRDAYVFQTEPVINISLGVFRSRAGAERVIDLHGRLDRVVCLDCGSEQEREAVQHQLLALNPQPDFAAAPAARPDGDSDLPETLVSALRPPVCHRCQGVIMPDVVFFGGTVPKPRVEACMQALDDADESL